MTEAIIRGLDFTGIDINPLAVLVCEAKAAIDAGADVNGAAKTVIHYLRTDIQETIDVEFNNRSKWFSDESAMHLSRVRRGIEQVADRAARKVLWTAFAETVRKSSNSRTSTYKLHIRKDDELVEGSRVASIFEDVLRQTLYRIEEYRKEHLAGRARKPKVRIICSDVRVAKLGKSAKQHDILVTSPPYGDNQTTIPYGQFSYLTLQWIPEIDLPAGWSSDHISNTHALDSSSLGGSKVGAMEKAETMKFTSPTFAAFVKTARNAGNTAAIQKVGCFTYDFLESLSQIRSQSSSSAHWILTTGNRTASGMRVPFDAICRDIVEFLGGKPIATLQRELPSKRMPSRNSVGEMITAEATLVAEFA
ncbi:hypothetical protein [Hylemonella gracilis]|nr:hypothetical protein [Hylemonella gracilis]